MKYVLPAFSPRKPAPSRARRRSAGEHGDAAPARASRAPTSGAPRLPQLRRVKFTGISHRRGKITFRDVFFFLSSTQCLVLITRATQPSCASQPPALLCVRWSPSGTASTSHPQPMRALGAPQASRMTFLTVLSYRYMIRHRPHGTTPYFASSIIESYNGLGWKGP